MRSTGPFERVPPEYTLFLDPAPRTQHQRTVLDLPDDTPVLLAGRVVEELLHQEPGVNGFVLKVAGERLGATSRDFLQLALPSAGQRSSDADRATQPGESTWYKLIRFECTGCDHRVFRVSYDPRDVPECDEPGHGAMRPRT
ncbi:hypothetical protein [Streptomyces afghaniensis]|uniref:hypothetical protein n=1 Tax=Streptomyces afghaniensis TaxID=66865 RepID=UPI0037A092EA